MTFRKKNKIFTSFNKKKYSKSTSFSSSLKKFRHKKIYKKIYKPISKRKKLFFLKRNLKRIRKYFFHKTKFFLNNSCYLNFVPIFNKFSRYYRFSFYWKRRNFRFRPFRKIFYLKRILKFFSFFSIHINFFHLLLNFFNFQKKTILFSSLLEKKNSFKFLKKYFNSIFSLNKKKSIFFLFKYKLNKKNFRFIYYRKRSLFFKRKLIFKKLKSSRAMVKPLFFRSRLNSKKSFFIRFFKRNAILSVLPRIWRKKKIVFIFKGKKKGLKPKKEKKLIKSFVFFKFLPKWKKSSKKKFRIKKKRFLFVKKRFLWNFSFYFILKNRKKKKYLNLKYRFKHKIHILLQRRVDHSFLYRRKDLFVSKFNISLNRLKFLRCRRFRNIKKRKRWIKFPKKLLPKSFISRIFKNVKKRKKRWLKNDFIHLRSRCHKRFNFSLLSYRKIIRLFSLIIVRRRYPSLFPCFYDMFSQKLLYIYLKDKKLNFIKKYYFKYARLRTFSSKFIFSLFFLDNFSYFSNYNKKKLHFVSSWFNKYRAYSLSFTRNKDIFNFKAFLLLKKKYKKHNKAISLYFLNKIASKINNENNFTNKLACKFHFYFNVKRHSSFFFFNFIKKNCFNSFNLLSHYFHYLFFFYNNFFLHLKKKIKNLKVFYFKTKKKKLIKCFSNKTFLFKFFLNKNFFKFFIFKKKGYVKRYFSFFFNKSFLFIIFSFYTKKKQFLLRLKNISFDFKRKKKEHFSWEKAKQRHKYSRKIKLKKKWKTLAILKRKKIRNLLTSDFFFSLKTFNFSKKLIIFPSLHSCFNHLNFNFLKKLLKFRAKLPFKKKLKFLRDPLYISKRKKRIKKFFIFSFFKSKKWSILLNNKFSKKFFNKSKLKKQGNRLKKAKFFLFLKRIQFGDWRRKKKSLFKRRLFSQKIFKSFFIKYPHSYFKSIFVSSCLNFKKHDKSFSKVSFRFYKNISFIVFRLGFLPSLTMAIDTVKSNWFCLNFQVAKLTDCANIKGDVLSLYPSFNIFSSYFWLRHFFLSTFFTNYIAKNFFYRSEKPFVVFAVNITHKNTEIFSFNEIFKSILIKNLFLLR